MGTWHQEDPEVQCVEALVEYLIDDEQTTFTAQHLGLVAANTRTSVSKVRKELESWGLTLASRPVERKVRGYSSWDNNRWQGNPCSGGSGWEQVTGFAGQEG